MAIIQPAFQARKGLVSASVFEREQEGEKGNFTSKSIALNISYVKDGAFVQKSLTIVKSNIDNVIAVLQKARKAMQAKK